MTEITLVRGRFHLEHILLIIAFMSLSTSILQLTFVPNLDVEEIDAGSQEHL